MEKMLIEQKILVNGFSLDVIGSIQMEKMFEQSGYPGLFFDTVKFLKIKNGIAYFKQISREDEIYVGLIFLDLEKGEVSVEACCESFDLEDYDAAMQYYRNIDGSKI